MVLATISLALSLPSLSTSGATDRLPPPEKLRYVLFRAGNEIGSGEVELIRDGSRSKMTSRLDVAVRFLGITLRRVDNTMSEEWVGDRLRSFASATDVDGTRRNLRIEPRGGVLVATDNGHERRLPADASPATFWRPVSVSTTELIDPVSGRLRRVRIADLGWQMLTVRGRPIPARHVSVVGEKMNREIWYGPDETIVRFEIRNRGDAVVVGELR